MRECVEVSPDQRNAWVVACLVGAMLLGTAMLLWLEPPAHGWSVPAVELGENVAGVRSVQIHFALADAALPLDEYDCVVYADGRCAWRPRSADIRLTLLGKRSNRLPEAQAGTLLAILGSMNLASGLDFSQVRLDPGSDPKLNPGLPPPAHELRALLERKGILQ